MVLEGWHSTKLGDVFTSRREKGLPGLPTLSVTLNDGLVLRDSLDRKTETNLSAREHLLVRKGDIAYNMMRMWQGASGLAEFDALVSPAYIVLRPKRGIDSVFGSYLLKSARMMYLLWAYSYGLTNDRLRLYFSDFSLIPVELPPIEEQRRIGMVLRTWDRAIETVDKLIENSEAQKRALMQRLFPNAKRVSPPSAQYDRLHLRDIADVNCRSLGGDTPSDFAFSYISLSDVEPGLISGNLEKHRFDEAPSRARRCVTAGDILMATVRPNLQAFARVTGKHAGCIASTGFAVITAKPGFDPDYVYQYLFSAHVTGQLNALVVGSNYPAVNASDVEALLIYCPPLGDQQRIARVLSALDLSLQKLSRRRDQLVAEKKALMQQLLTGKKRVKVTNDAAPLSATG